MLKRPSSAKPNPVAKRPAAAATLVEKTGGTKAIKRPGQPTEIEQTVTGKCHSLRKMQTRHGSAFCAPCPGPATLEEIWSWPRRTLELFAAKHGDQWETLVHNLGTLGVTLGTLYSGLCTPELCLAWVGRAMRSMGLRDDISCSFACDCADGPQLVMRAMSERCGLRHVFGDMVAFLHSEAAAGVVEISERGLEGPRHFEAIASLFFRLEQQDQLFTDNASAGCLLHHDCGMCKWSHENSENSHLQLMVAGSTCTGWSSRGVRLGAEDTSMLPFLIFMFVVRRLQPDILLHECTVNFDVGLLRKYIGNFYRIVSFVASPQLVGLPVQRSRRFTMCMRTESIMFGGSVLEFESQLSASIELSGDAFFMADASSIEEEARCMETARRFDIGGKYDDWCHLYSPCTNLRLTELAAQQDRRASPDGTYLVEIGQNAEFQVFDQGCAPCLCRNSQIFSFKHKRHMVPAETLLVHGFPVLPQALPEGSEFTVPWADLVTNGLLSRRQITTLVGNGMQGELVGKLLLYMLSRVHRTPSVSVKVSQLLMPPLEFEDEDVE